jgi:pSer/pThr/pTyr-binding forkhead associated (FHA) protein
LEIEDEEETELGRGMRDDVTELEVKTGVGPLAMLWVTEGPRRGKFYPIRHGTLIGRKEGSLILDDPKVSGTHAKFTMEKDDLFIWDFGSANGTYVNGKKIREATLLEENDVVKIGDTFFVVKLLESKPKRRTNRMSEGKKSAGSKSTAKSSKKART